MKIAAGISLLGVGFLFGFAMGETPISEQPPPIKAPQRVMAQEREKSPDETCLYTRPDGRTYTLAIHEGTTCVTIIGDKT